jgi:hypothetical protein
VATFMGGTAPLTPAPQPLPGARGAIALSHSTEHTMLPAPHIRVHSWFKKTPHARPLQHRSRARKPELQRFVSIRVHSWFKTTPTQGPCSTDLGLESPSCKNSCSFVSIRGSKKHPREVPAGQISGSKARATKIRAHSWPFVVQKNTPRQAPAAQISRSRARATKIRVHSCSFVVQNNTHTRSPQHRSRVRKPKRQKFVPIRVHSWFKKKHPRKVPAAQISGSKARATKIRAHSCSFVVQNNTHAKPLQHRSRDRKPELQRFVSIRVHSWFKTTPTRSPCSTDLALESPGYKNSCSFVFIRGSKQHPRKVPAAQNSRSKARATKIRGHSCSFVVQNNTPRKVPCSTDLELESPSYKNSCPFVFIRGSKRPSSEISENSSKSCQGFHSAGE